jgi:hypothetical protein
LQVYFTVINILLHLPPFNFVAIDYRVNTFGAKVKVGKDERGDDLFHAPHEYTDTLKNIYLSDFKESVEYAAYRERSGGKDLGYSKFKEGVHLCPCVGEPKMRVCVDELETGFAEMVECLKTILRRSSRMPCDCGFCTAEAQKEEELGKGILKCEMHYIIYCSFV